MSRITNTMVKLIIITLLLGAGLGVFAIRITEDVSNKSQYNKLILSAREKTEKGIYYYAKQDYLSAFYIYNGDQDLFREFLDFLGDIEDDSYRNYLKKYLSLYPTDTKAYEKLCEIYYEEESYKEVQKLLASAKTEGATSEVLMDYNEKVEYKYVDVPGAYDKVSNFYGKQAIIERNNLKGIYYFGNGVIIPPEYDEITYCINGVSAACKEGEYYFIDAMGNKSGVLSTKVDSLSILANQLSAVSIGNGYGYVDKTLEVPSDLPYEYATPFSNGIAAVIVSGKWGVINGKQEFIVNPIYDEIKLTEFGTCISSGVIFAKDGSHYIMLNEKGELLSEYQFEEVNTFLGMGQPAAVKLDGKWTFVKNTGELFEVDQNLYAAGSFNNYLAPVTLDGEKWGYMDGYGKIVIEPQYVEVLPFSEYGVAPVKRDELWYFIQLLKYKQ
ncbi:WG repeat-containing protein [Lachnospiraceae bacterium OttesenSCG-928-D06]|nr:WG repeat-containing protein [Lachnospiraceae bacterium OttesenSCG-928-D06]